MLQAFTLWSSLILPELRPKTALVGWWCSVLFFPTYTHALRKTSPTFLRFIGFDGCFHATTKPGQQWHRREGMHHSWWLIVEAVPSTCRELNPVLPKKGFSSALVLCWCQPHISKHHKPHWNNRDSNTALHKNVWYTWTLGKRACSRLSVSGCHLMLSLHRATVTALYCSDDKQNRSWEDI